jgi:MFS family permease
MSALAAPVPPGAATVAERMTPKAVWTLAITSVAVFMVTLDNLVVTTAIPVIRQDLHAGLSGLQWTVNAYTLTFAVLLLTGSALGDRFGRRRLLAIGIAISRRRPPEPRWPPRSWRSTLLARCRAWAARSCCP